MVFGELGGAARIEDGVELAKLIHSRTGMIN
jgi:hypothetical protein